MSTRLPPLHDPPVGFGRPGDDEAASGLDGLGSIIARGATGLAARAWATADGVAVLHPRGRFGSRFRRRAIAEVDARELPDRTPTLAGFYAEVGTGPNLSLDVEDNRALDAVLAAARAAGPVAESNLWLCHRDLAVLTPWRSRTTARLLNTIARSDAEGGLERRAAELEQRDIDGLVLEHHAWSGGRVALLHRFGRLALGRGVIHEREVAALVDTGIDGVYSSHVERMMAVMALYYGSG